MPELSPGKPVTSKTPELLVENKLEAGRYRFELVVVDDSGLESAPTELVVSVQAAKEGVVTKPDLSGRIVARPSPAEPEPIVTPVKPVVPQPTELKVEPVVLQPTKLKVEPVVLQPTKLKVEPVVLQPTKLKVEPVATPVKPTELRPVKPK